MVVPQRLSINKFIDREACSVCYSVRRVIRPVELGKLSQERFYVENTITQARRPSTTGMLRNLADRGADLRGIELFPTGLLLCPVGKKQRDGPTHVRRSPNPSQGDYLQCSSRLDLSRVVDSSHAAHARHDISEPALHKKHQEHRRGRLNSEGVRKF